MINSNIQKSIIAFFSVLFFVTVTGCGKAHFKTIKEATDLSAYNDIYVSNTVISSHEQEENFQALNVEFAQFYKDEVVNAVAQKSQYSLIEAPASSAASLVIESSINIIYGSRALRYWVGFGAGKGSVVINMKLKDAAASEVMFELESKSDLSVGAFGGSMDKVIKNSIKKIVRQFVAKL